MSQLLPPNQTINPASGGTIHGNSIHVDKIEGHHVTVTMFALPTVLRRTQWRHAGGGDLHFHN